MDKEFYVNLRKAIHNAVDAALNNANVIDDGTCNFDQPMIDLPEGVLKSELKENGVPVEYCDYGFYKGSYFVKVPLYGQAGKRTKMAEAAAKSLQKDGFNSFVWYCMD